MMKILVAGLCNNYGGIESFFFGYFNEIMKNDTDIIFDILGFKGVVNANLITENGGTVFPIESFSKNEIEEFMKEHAKNYDALWYLAVDLSSINIIKYAKQYGIKRIILHSHCSSMMRTGLGKIKGSMLHYIHRLEIVKYVTDYWACSDFAAKWMFPRNVVENKVVYICNAIDAEKYRFNDDLRNKKRNELNCEDTLAIGVIGRLSPEKNPEFSIKVCKEISKKRKCILFIVGKGPLESDLRKTVENCGLKNVRFLGLRKDVNELMQALDYVLIPSHFEGMPMVAIEAQTSGVPLIAASEGITKQICILNTTSMLRLADGEKVWADKIVTESRADRGKAYYVMRENGYSLPEAAVELYKLLKK